MAKANKSKKKSPSRSKTKSSSKNKGGISIIKTIIVVIVLFIVAAVMSYIYLHYFRNDKPSTQVTEIEQTALSPKETQPLEDVTPKKSEKIEPNKTEKTENQSSKTSIEGTWVSNLSGTMLTFKGDQYNIDFMGVESTKPFMGTFSISGNEIKFVNSKKNTICALEEGIYTFTFKGNNIIFTTKKDNCNKRSLALQSEWYKF